MKILYVIMLADENGNFHCVYPDPNPFYPTREEAEKVRKQLIKMKEKLTEENSRVNKMYKIEI